MVSEMRAAARSACENCIAATDGTRIGAAVIDEKSRVFVGCYVGGTTAYCSLHAEHVAIASAITHGAKHIEALAIYISSEPTDALPVPCGTCLQLIADFCNSRKLEIHGSNEQMNPEWITYELNQLLPIPWVSR